MLSCSHKTVFANAPAMGKIGRDFGHAFSFAVRLAAHVSNGLKSRIHPVVGRI